MFIQESCAGFLDKLAAKDAVPGGGGAAAFAGALGAALASMVCNLTLGKKKISRSRKHCARNFTSNNAGATRVNCIGAS